MTDEIRLLLRSLYGSSTGTEVYDRLQARLARFPVQGSDGRRWSADQRDAFLIAYPDQIREAGAAPLRTLRDFLRQHSAGNFTALHLLPFFPSSSDDGYSVTEYRTVDPAYGDWDDIANLSRTYHLMFDAVINHASVRGAWFTSFIRDEPEFAGYFLEVAGSPDLSAVVRPRDLPLLTAFASPSGMKRIWTTFGPDQADLNYANPEVLLAMIELLLFYAARGADLIRLDAVAYLWKEIGTRCIHLPQTYTVIQLFRAILDIYAPHVALVTETNVPHVENISYFGDGRSFAQLVYNFALPPLVLHAILTGSSSALSGWLLTLSTPPGDTTFLNFLASHDGIGLQPLRGILTDREFADFVTELEARGALISYKAGPGGGRSPYELNMNYFDAVNWAHDDEPEEIQVARFLAAHAILLSIIGVPAIYFHSLFGSRGWAAGPSQTGQKRSINRQRLVRDEVEAELAEPGSRRSAVKEGLSAMLRARAASAAFHPQGSQEVIVVGSGALVMRRASPDGDTAVLCLINLTAKQQVVKWDAALFGDLPTEGARELITNLEVPASRLAALRLRPYESLWLAHPAPRCEQQ